METERHLRRPFSQNHMKYVDFLSKEGFPKNLKMLLLHHVCSHLSLIIFFFFFGGGGRETTHYRKFRLLLSVVHVIRQYKSLFKLVSFAKYKPTEIVQSTFHGWLSIPFRRKFKQRAKLKYMAKNTCQPLDLNTSI